ncbi:MAG: hypothetical protein GF350_14875 [Chitinivibrionales bacterium]|nr:hypothetical protein [Chitinivibrionales bacterium]
MAQGEIIISSAKKRPKPSAQRRGKQQKPLFSPVQLWLDFLVLACIGVILAKQYLRLF